MAQPDDPYYEWQLEVVLTNMGELGIDLSKVILLFTDRGKHIPDKIASKYPVKCFKYPDKRPALASQYIPSIRPYLWSVFLEENPEYCNEDFVYQDSDIIYREPLDFNQFPLLASNHWYGADVESYVGPDYLGSKGKDILQRISYFLGLSNAESMMAFKGRSIGAQWIISKPTKEYWEDVYQKSYTLYSWMNKVQHQYDYILKYNGGTQDYFIQVWCAEMYAELYLCNKYGITTEKSKELEFSWSTDNISRYQETKILHNAGVTEEMRVRDKAFYKGEYIARSPLYKNLSWVNQELCSSEYAKAIGKVRK